MTPRFKKAIPYIFEHEGGYNDIKGDSGGATNWGISLTFLKSAKKDINGDGKIDWLDIKNLTEEEAEDIYWNNFWKPSYDIMPEKIGIKIFDIAVNAGHQRAHLILQKSLNDLGSKIPVDGIMGQVTIKECAKYDIGKVLEKIKANQIAFYTNIVKNKPSQQKFLKGWINRANWLPS
jgi:lysozyme family protein